MKKKRQSEHQTEQHSLLLGLSLRAAARALNISHPTLQHYLTTGEIPRKHPDLPIHYAALKKTKEEPRMLTKQPLPPEACRHWGFSKDPFTAEIDSPEDILDLKEATRAERKILAAVDHAGWVVITGAVGSGKTTLLKKVSSRLAQRKDVDLVFPRMLEKQYLAASHICDSIIEDLGDGRVPGRGTLEGKARHVGRLLEDAYRDGKKIALLIDEAHLLRPEALLGLKRIHEFETRDYKKLLAIILIGQSPLARMLRTNYALSEVAQRVDLYEIPPMNGSLAIYLRHKLSRAGIESKEIFQAAAIRALGERADTPLSMNNLAAAALLEAWRMGEQEITADTIKSL